MSIRQTALALALVVAAAATPALSQTPGTAYPGDVGFVPLAPSLQLTREQVRSELSQFVKQGGQLAAGELGLALPAPTGAGLTREQVKQELAEFLRQGGHVSSGEFDMSQMLPVAAGTNTRGLGASPARTN